MTRFAQRRIGMLLQSICGAPNMTSDGNEK
jgi:hypothetical protein